MKNDQRCGASKHRSSQFALRTSLSGVSQTQSAHCHVSTDSSLGTVLTATEVRGRSTVEYTVAIVNPNPSGDAGLSTKETGFCCVHYVEIPAVQSQQQSPSVENANKKKVHM